MEFHHLRLFKSKTHTLPKKLLVSSIKNKTAFITVVGEKDRYRLKGKYFEPYHPDKIEKGYEDKGYVYVTAQGGGISGTEVRKSLSSGDDEVRKKGFKKAYNGKFDPKIYKFITNRLSKIEIYNGKIFIYI